MPGFLVLLRDSAAEMKPAPPPGERNAEVMHGPLGLDEVTLGRLKQEAIV